MTEQLIRLLNALASDHECDDQIDAAETCTKAADTLASLTAERDRLRDERRMLAKYFREEDPSVGFEGDVEGWSPAETAIVVMRRLTAERDALKAEVEMLREALERLVSARALAGVRELVAGWNGEERPEGRHTERHPSRLGATLPKTNCGAVYELDEAMQFARATLAERESKP